MHNDIIAQVEESKNEAKRLMRQAKYRTGTTAEEEEKSREISRQEIIKELHNKNHSLTVLLLKMKAMGQWRRNHDSGIHSRTVCSMFMIKTDLYIPIYIFFGKNSIFVLLITALDSHLSFACFIQQMLSS